MVDLFEDTNIEANVFTTEVVSIAQTHLISSVHLPS